MSGKFRVFLSAVNSEFEHARAAVANDLRARGLEVRDELNFRQEKDADTTLRKLHDYIRDCDAVVCIVGKRSGSLAPQASAAPYATMLPDGFDEATFTQWEFWFARHHGKQLSVYVAREDFVPHQSAFDGEECPDLQARFVRHIEGVGRDRSAFSSVHELCREVLKADWPDHRAPKPNNLPFATLGNLFVGREDFLEKLRQALTSQTPGDLGQGYVAAITQPAAIHALGGQGKTRAALEYAWKYQAEYSALLFVSAPTSEQLRKSIADLCNYLRIPKEQAPEDDEPLCFQASLDWLRTHDHWLLLIDNVDTSEVAVEVHGILPQLTKGHVIITSRIADWRHGVKPLGLEVLTVEAGADLVLKATDTYRLAQPAEDLVIAREISTDQGHLALGLQQAAAYISRRRIKLATYRTEWAEKRAEVLKTGRRLGDYPESLFTTWNVTFSQMTPPARALLERICWLAPEPLPRDFIGKISLPRQWRDFFRKPDTKEAIFELLSWHFLEPVEGSEEVKAHLMVLEITRQQLKARGNELEALLRTLLSLVAVTRGSDPQDVCSWPALDPLRSHLAEASIHATTHGKYKSVIKLAIGMKNQLAGLYNARALHHQSELLLREALRLSESHLGSQHVTTSFVLNNLALVLRVTNRLGEAEPLMRRALAINEASYGVSHPNVAAVLNNLAQLLQATNRLGEAEPLMRRALAINESSYGANHPNVATALNNLGSLLEATNRMREAEPLMRRALAINEASYGVSHPNVTTALNNLALLLQATDRLGEAEPLMRRALAIDEASYGADHPHVATDLNNLALLLRATNRLGEAEPLMWRALAIDEASYGADHPDVATGLNNLGSLLEATNRLGEAEPLMRRALAIDEASYGKDHPNVARDLNNLASLLKATNRLGEAETLSRRHLEIFVKFSKATGHEHTHYRDAIGNYCGVLEEMGMCREAIDEKLQAITASAQEEGE